MSINDRGIPIGSLLRWSFTPLNKHVHCYLGRLEAGHDLLRGGKRGQDVVWGEDGPIVGVNIDETDYQSVLNTKPSTSPKFMWELVWLAPEGPDRE